jgi:Domain of unknown function (DUF4252)
VRLSRILLPLLITASAALAQSQSQSQPLPPQQNWVQQNWFPQEIESLGQNASSRTEFSLDHNMVVLASKMDQDDDSLRRVIAGVDGVSVHRFKFQGTGMYDPQILNAVRQDYRAAGWQHLADAHQKYGYPQGADLWLHFDHNTIRNIAFLVTRADQVALVSVSGSISPVDLLHLAGHFGIPRMEGGVVIPAPGAGPAPPDASVPPPPADNRPATPDDDYRHDNPPTDASPPSTPN